MKHKVFLTCAVTGAGDTVSRHDGVPVTPTQVAAACVDAERVGASIVHVHVRDSGTDIVLNLTAGMGGQLNLAEDDPAVMVTGTDLAKPLERLAHVTELLPEMCTLDCGSMNFSRDVVINRIGDLEKMARHAQQLGVKPELEVFDLGQIETARHLIASGLIDGRPLFQLCLGIVAGAPATTEAMIAMRNALPANADWAALLGGNVRVGLEDNLWLEKGVLASNAQLVEKAIRILELLDVSVLTPEATRQQLGLTKRW